MSTLTDTGSFPGIFSALTLAGILASCAWMLASL